MSSAGEKLALEAKIKNIDQQVAVLQELKAQCLQKLQALSVPVVPAQSQPVTTSLDEKTAIFFSYFHGREDVYAKLWVNNRTGKRGYSPACKHEWVRSLCRKPAVKCSECPNQQFLPFDEATIWRGGRSLVFTRCLRTRVVILLPSILIKNIGWTTFVL